eukprot:1194173-Prorocentrum_minimum.AAC.7
MNVVRPPDLHTDVSALGTIVSKVRRQTQRPIQQAPHPSLGSDCCAGCGAGGFGNAGAWNPQSLSPPLGLSTAIKPLTRPFTTQEFDSSLFFTDAQKAPKRKTVPYQALTKPLPSPYQALTKPLPSPYQALTKPLPSPYQALIKPKAVLPPKSSLAARPPARPAGAKAGEPGGPAQPGGPGGAGPAEPAGAARAPRPPSRAHRPPRREAREPRRQGGAGRGGAERGDAIQADGHGQAERHAQAAGHRRCGASCEPVLRGGSGHGRVHQAGV